MKIKLFVAVIVFAVSMFCGSVIVTNGILAGRYETLFLYTEKDVCTEGEKLVLEKETSTTGGTVVIGNDVYTDTAFTANTLFCVNEAGEKRDVTNETYVAVESLQKRIGWWSTIGFFLVTMIFILLFEKPILRRIDKVIGYNPPEER